MIVKLFGIFLLFLFFSCSSRTNNIVEEKDDPDEHDAMCTCDECMEEDTFPEIEDSIDY